MAEWLNWLCSIVRQPSSLVDSFMKWQIYNGTAILWTCITQHQPLLRTDRDMCVWAIAIHHLLLVSFRRLLSIMSLCFSYMNGEPFRIVTEWFYRSIELTFPKVTTGTVIGMRSSTAYRASFMHSTVVFFLFYGTELKKKENIDIITLKSFKTYTISLRPFI